MQHLLMQLHNRPDIRMEVYDTDIDVLLRTWRYHSLQSRDYHAANVLRGAVIHRNTDTTVQEFRNGVQIR